jgi:HSP20 family protein
MLVRFESTPISASPLEVLFDRTRLFPEMMWHGAGVQTEAFPYVNIADMNDTLHVAAEIPGVPKSDIKIHLQNDLLTISGDRKQPEVKEGGAWVRREIAYGPFERTFKLPYDVDASKVTAEYSDGILRVKLPKTEASKPKAIVVQ